MKRILCKQFGCWFELEITDVSRTESKQLSSEARPIVTASALDNGKLRDGSSDRL